MDIKELLAREYWSEAEGRRAVELWRASGAPVSEFARRTGLKRARLAYWASRVGHKADRAKSVALATVTVVPSGRAGSITIELRSGRAIRVEGEVDEAVLERVIAVAERAPC